MIFAFFEEIFHVNPSLVFPNSSIAVAQSPVLPASLADLLNSALLRVDLDAALLPESLAAVVLDVDVVVRCGTGTP
jgi:hypothetical protein